MRLDGNSFLIIDGDAGYAQCLVNSIRHVGGICSAAAFLEDAKNVLKSSDVDVIICSYYLPDGIIHQLIDWCKFNLEVIPTFTTVGYPINGENDFAHRQLIAEVFYKAQDHQEIIHSLTKIVFNFEHFKESLIDCIEPRGISLELFSQRDKHCIKAIELTTDSLFISAAEKFDFGSFGLLRVTIFDGGNVEHFAVIGFFEGHFSGGQHFKIHSEYGSVWSRLLDRLEEKQLSIDHFLQKAAGK